MSKPLTDRQLQILQLVARGATNRKVGVQLGVSERTVRNHLRTILRKLKSPDRTHAVVLAISNGWIAIPIQPDQEPSPVKGEDEAPREAPSNNARRR